MEYHKERFEDYSLVVFKDEVPVALLAANKVEDSLISHQGLTYGGLLFKLNLRLTEAIQAYRSVLKYLEDQGIKFLQIKAIPRIYHKLASDELDYVAFKTDADIIRCDTISVISSENRLDVDSSNRKRGLKRALSHGLKMKEENDFEFYWNSILIPNLEKRHRTKPTHSLAEIQLLKERFPINIRQFNVYKDDKIVAGVTIFETNKVAHVQYISAGENKQELGSLDFAFHKLITKTFKDKAYFDFGVSHENEGQNINEGLLNWKEDFGARSIAQPFYKIKTENHLKLNDIML